MVLGGENVLFIKEAARWLVGNCTEQRIVPTTTLSSFLNDVKRKHRDRPDFGPTTWDGREAPNKTLEELAENAEKSRVLSADELEAYLANPDDE